MTEFNEQKFPEEFLTRTYKLLEQYCEYVKPNVGKEAYETTLLINCLLGLLLLPKEKAMLDCISSETKIERMISPKACSSLEYNKKKICQYCSQNQLDERDICPNSLRGLAWNLRHSVAHFCIKPMQESKEVKGYKFENDRMGFKIELENDDIRKIVLEVAGTLACSPKVK
ncbi:HEPN family nuclease [Candidatus Mycalebacterium sp.]